MTRGFEIWDVLNWLNAIYEALAYWKDLSELFEDTSFALLHLDKARYEYHSYCIRTWKVCSVQIIGQKLVR